MKNDALIIAVHTSTLRLSVAVVRKRGVLKEVTLEQGKRHLEQLAPTIAVLCQELKITLADAACLAVAIGPGSFSGIRIGMATVKGLAMAGNKPVIGVSCLEILAFQALALREFGAAIIDAKRNQTYIALYRNQAGVLNSGEDPRLVENTLLNNYLRKRKCAVVIGERAFGHLEDIEFRPASPSAGVCGLIAAQRFESGSVDDLHMLKPLYLRRSDAEEKATV